jgi:hypothetical protein
MPNRRQFMRDVGRGMLVAGVGYGTAVDLGLASAGIADGRDRLTFGPLEPLVGMMQDTPANRLLPLVVDKLKSGTALADLVRAAALANARTFGGEDYVGFHTIMALAPAYEMARETPGSRQALPVLKVLYRNTHRIQEFGGASSEVLHPIDNPAPSPSGDPGEAVRAAVRGKDVDKAEQVFAGIARQSAEAAFNAVLYAVQDNTEVHRVVLPYRAYVLVDLLGPEHAGTLLRQSLRYCLRSERQSRSATWDEPRTLLPKLFDQHKLPGRNLGTRTADDVWVDKLAQTIFQSTPQQAADTAAAALAEGFAPDAIGEAIALAANQLILRDIGRTARDESPNKPMGSCHGDSIGVHACDSANAWRNLARASNPRNTYACLILGAYQVALDRVARGGDFLNWQPLPLPYHVTQVKQTDPAALLNELDTAIRGSLQARACAIVQRYGELGHPARGIFDVCLRYATSEDGALHAEKYYRTVSEEFAATRAAFRWRQLVGLARVTASEFGRPAPGYAQACELLGV